MLALLPDPAVTANLAIHPTTRETQEAMRLMTPQEFERSAELGRMILDPRAPGGHLGRQPQAGLSRDPSVCLG
jgi:hypothetical protein